MPTEPPAPPMTHRPPWWWLAFLLAAEIVLAAVLIVAAMLFSFMPFFADFADSGSNISMAQDLLFRAASIFYGLSAILAVCSISQQHSRYHIDVIVGAPLAVASGLWGGTLIYKILAPSVFVPANHSFTALAIVAGLLHLTFAGTALVGVITRRSWWFRLARHGATGLIASSAATFLAVCLQLFSAEDAGRAVNWELSAITMALGIAAAVLGRARSKTRPGN